MPDFLARAPVPLAARHVRVRAGIVRVWQRHHEASWQAALGEACVEGSEKRARSRNPPLSELARATRRWRAAAGRGKNRRRRSLAQQHRRAARRGAAVGSRVQRVVAWPGAWGSLTAPAAGASRATTGRGRWATRCQQWPERWRGRCHLVAVGNRGARVLPFPSAPVRSGMEPCAASVNPGRPITLARWYRLPCDLGLSAV